MTPFRNAQLQIFFEEKEHIGLKRNTRLWLEEEEITGVDCMAHFDKDQLDTAASILNWAWTKEGAAHDQPYRFRAHVQRKIAETCKLIWFYKTAGQDMTLGSLRYGVTLNFVL